MRSPDLRHRLAAGTLVATALFFALLGVWTMVVRSAIPLRIDGTVTSVDARQEKHPGVDDAWFVGVDGKERHLDTELARSLSVGDTVHKDRWADTLVVNGRPRPLRLSDDTTAMMLLAPAAVLACAALALPSRRARRRPASGGGEHEDRDLAVGA
jgi:hypothetical protein